MTLSRRVPALAALVAAALLGAAPSAGAAPAQERQARASVVGGTPARAEAWPWIAALVPHGAPAQRGVYCGGALIAPDAVLTAAHCVAGSRAGEVDVVLGRTRLSAAGGERLAVRSIALAPAFDTARGRHDAAVLRLVTPSAMPTVAIADGANAGLLRARAAVRLAGWGVTGREGRPSDDLREASVVVRSDRGCRSIYGGAFDAPAMACASAAGGGHADSCNGDSGGPLVADGPSGAVLVGLVSFGPEDCGDPLVPGVYTRVSAVARWVAAAAALPGAPAPEAVPGASGPARVRLTNISCRKVRCHVDVSLSGSRTGVSRVMVEILRGGTRVVRRATATRIDDARWRAGMPPLPTGRLTIRGRALDGDGRAVGRAARLTVDVDK